MRISWAFSRANVRTIVLLVIGALGHSTSAALRSIFRSRSETLTPICLSRFAAMRLD